MEVGSTEAVVFKGMEPGLETAVESESSSSESAESADCDKADTGVEGVGEYLPEFDSIQWHIAAGTSGKIHLACGGCNRRLHNPRLGQGLTRNNTL